MVVALPIAQANNISTGDVKARTARFTMRLACECKSSSIKIFAQATSWAAQPSSGVAFGSLRNPGGEYGGGFLAQHVRRPFNAWPERNARRVLRCVFSVIGGVVFGVCAFGVDSLLCLALLCLLCLVCVHT